jgi:predicted Zn-dependent protease
MPWKKEYRAKAQTWPQWLSASALAAGLLMVGALWSAAHASGYNVHAGAVTAQTMHHCGWVPAKREIYTNASRNTAIIQRKLTEYGYYRGAVDGVNGPLTRQAVALFQRDYGLRIDGIVGIQTATTIGYSANANSWVRQCHRPYNKYAAR